MYNPIQDGIEKSAIAVRYAEAKPPEHFSGLVHCYWELKTEAILEENFFLHAIPDACVNILFNQVEPEIAGITALRTKFEMLNLGRSFHYVGIQLLPGVWQGCRLEITDQFVGNSYAGELPLVATSKELEKRQFLGKQELLSELVQWFLDTKLVVNNFVTQRILSNIDTIRSVTDMASVACLSPRQLQRSLKQTTGFAPHDLLKVLRVQRSFQQHYLDLYADQSHYIHAFRNITGYTPAKYANKFDV